MYTSSIPLQNGFTVTAISMVRASYFMRGADRPFRHFFSGASWIGQHGWIVGVALMGGGVVHQQYVKSKAPGAGQAATFAIQTASVLPTAQGPGPFVRIYQALGGDRR
jgi:hypothetical protein